MQNHGKRGRNRPSPNPRVGRMGGRGPLPTQQTRETFHGVYSDQCFTHVAAILKGCTVLLQVKSGSIYEGILTTVSAQAEIVLEAAHLLDQPGVNSGVVPTLNKISFKAATIVSITAKDVDPEFAARGGRDALMTDAEIARRQNGQAGERELEEWQGATTEGDSLTLDGSGDVHSNGWSAEEMFKTNESRYGVTSSYDDSLPEYTTSLDQSNPKVYQERKEKAERLAREMENSPQASGNVEADDITDEEDKFSAVSRSGEAAGNRYIPPHQRENTRGGHPPQHAPGPRRTQMQRMPGPGRPMSSPHHIHTHSPPHPHTQQVQGHPHGHPHQPMQPQQQPPIHMYPNQQARLPQPGPQPSLPLQQQQAQHQQPLQQHQQQQQQQQLQKHHPPPQQQPAQVHLPSHGRTPPQQPGQTPPRVQPPTQLPSRPLGLGSQSPRSSPLPNTDTSPSVREEKPHATVTEERQQQSTDDSSKRKPETNPPERTSESAPPAVPEKNHKNEKTIAELKEFRDTFVYENKPVEDEATSIPSTQAASEAKAPTTTEKTTPTVPQPAEERETKDMDTSSGKDSPSNPNKDKDKQLNPLAKPFVPTFTRNHKTPTPPRPQLSPSPAMVLQHTQPYSQQPNMIPFVLSSGQGYQGAMPTPQQTAVAQAQQVSHMAPKPMMPKKGYAFASSATNIPHQRPQPPNELPTLIPNASMAAGQPLVSPMGYPHPSQMLHYPPQPGIPGQPMLPQAGPYQMYQAKHPVPYRPIQPQPSIQGVPQPTAAPHIHTLPEGNIPGNSPVLVSNTQLQAQAGQVQQSMHAQISHQQQQQQQAQQQQQQHAQQQTQQQQQQPQHHHHPQSVVHLQPQHQHPHAQPHTTPPQQQAHGSQPSQIPQPQPPPQQQQPQQQPQQQQQQQHRPTPSPVHHMPHQQHQGHQPHVSQHQNMAHHLHPQSQQILYHQAQLQPGHLQSMAIQSSQPQQQQQFGGPHPYPQYITSTTIPATNITSVTPVHTNPHPHPTQANWMILPGQPMNPMVHNSGQMAAHLLPQPQGLGQAHGHVQAFQQGN